MVLTYTDILKSRGLVSVSALWRLKVTLEEINGVVSHINRYIDTSFRDPKEKYELIGREICLVYAYWWTNEYDGGPRKYTEALTRHGIDPGHKPLVERIIKYMFSDTRNGLEMTLYHSERRNLYLQSVVSQGGLPNALLKDADNQSQYATFVRHLVDEYEGIDNSDIDWNDLSCAKEVASRHIQSKIIRDCDEIIENAIEFVKAYLNGDSSYFEDNEVLKKIVEGLKDRNPQKDKVGAFSAQWQFKVVDNNELKLYYTVRAPHTLGELDIDDDRIVNFYANDLLVGSYQKHNQAFVLIPGSGSSTFRLCTSLSERIKFCVKKFRGQETPKSEPCPLINAEPPFMEEPLLLQWTNGGWSPYANKSTEVYACLYPAHWHCDAITDSATVHIADKEYQFKVFDWSDIGQSSLSFTDTETGDNLVLRKSYSEYSVAVTNPVPEWIEETSVSILWQCSNLNAVFRKYQNGQKYEGRGSDFKVLYRMKWEREYKPLRYGKIPTGPLAVKVIYPDSYERTFSFYSISGLEYERVDDSTFGLVLNGVRAQLLSGQDNITKVECNANTYHLCDTTTTDALRPINFRISPADRPLYGTVIAVRSPHDATCFLDELGNILVPDVMRNKLPIVAYDKLTKYYINLDDTRDIALTFEEHNVSFLKQRIRLPKGKYDLSILSDYIERMFSIGGFNDYYKRIIVHAERHKSNACIEIKYHSYIAQTQTKDGITGVMVYQNDLPVSGLTLYACPVAGTYEQTEAIPMLEDGEGLYYLAADDAKDIDRCVIFNDKFRDSYTLKPMLLKLDDIEDELDRSELKRSSIASIADLLLAKDERAWDEVRFHTSLAMKYRLPYINSFNCFQAIASHPALIAMFISRIPYMRLGYEDGFVVEELMRMEQDLGFCFYAIPRRHWQEIKSEERMKYDAMVAMNENIKQSEEFASLDNYLIFCGTKYLNELLKSQFGEQFAPLLYNKLVNQYPLNFEIPVDQDLLDQSYYVEYNFFNTPERLKFPEGLLTPRSLRDWRTIGNYPMQKLLYLSDVIPQDIALQSLGDADNLWCPSQDENPEKRKKTNIKREFKRRMHNYLRKYDRERYNTLYAHTLFKIINQPH